MSKKVYLVTKEEFPRYMHKLYIRGPFDGGLETFQIQIQFYTKENVTITKDNYDSHIIEINDGILTNNIYRNYIVKDHKNLPILSWRLSVEDLECEVKESFDSEDIDTYHSTSSLEWTMSDSVKEVF